MIEVACGLSPRGLAVHRALRRPAHVRRGRPAGDGGAQAARAANGSARSSERHRVASVDALRDDGPGSLAALAAELDREQGLAIVTEGLLGYLDDDAV